MSDELKLFIWVVLVLALIYVLWFGYAFVSLRGFLRKMKRKLSGSAVLFASKRDLLLSVYAYCEKAGAELEEDDAERATKARWVKFEIKKAEDVERVSGELSSFEKRLMRLVSANEYLSKGQEFVQMKESLNDVNANYRRIVAQYDNDLGGYNYWRKHFMFRWLFFIFGYREKRRLS